jgi:hypothetical protein
MPSMANQGSSSGANETSKLPSQATTSLLAVKTSGLRDIGMAPSRSFRAFCRTPEKMGSYARICRKISTLTASQMQLAADCRGLRKKELKTGY